MPSLLTGTELKTLQRQTSGVTRDRMLRELAEAVEVVTAEQPLELLERLTSRVPAPGRPLLSYHGVLAPHAASRAAIVLLPAAQDDARAAAPERP